MRKGYGVVTATSGCEGLRLLMTQTVDAVVLEYYGTVGRRGGWRTKMKHIRPHLPVVMVADPRGLPHEALKSVDAWWINRTGRVWCGRRCVFLLTTKAQDRSALGARPMRERHGGIRRGKRAMRSNQIAAKQIAPKQIAADRSQRASPFSTELWKDILDGTVQFQPMRGHALRASVA